MVRALVIILISLILSAVAAFMAYDTADRARTMLPECPLSPSINCI
ncbi:hypothetical protein Entcl_2647 [[Enterobacter] lignolyticus SCF1]|uniref:Uncharacterized protein n=1 Tax=Enterobacter lignolyticus (strain SCF1) TaxID=701347 RepID=E3GBD4_ENTLS|nr:hypothetical protein Entcl_2647 [[Enterobacter] lignolyticus SCF1]